MGKVMTKVIVFMTIEHWYTNSLTCPLYAGWHIRLRWYCTGAFISHDLLILSNVNMMYALDFSQDRSLS